MSSNSERNKEYWRDKTGKIVCSGDDCVEECTDECPIWCNTLAANFFALGELSKAIEVLLKAVEIAPDFKDAWNNLGSMYGSLNRHKDALDAYQKAYELDHNYKNAIYGIAVSSKNLGYYQECLNWCNLYKEQFHDVAIDRVIEDCNKKMVDNLLDENTSNKNNEVPNIGDHVPSNNNNKRLEEEYGKLIPLLLNDETIDEGYSKIEELFNKGFFEAGIILGQRYSAVDREKAKQFFSVPARDNEAEALWGLANCLKHNYVPDENNKEDVDWVNTVLKAAHLGCPDAMNEAGNIENRRNNYYMSAYWYGLAELYEHPEAIYGCKGIAKRWVEAGKPSITDEFVNDPLYQQGEYMIKTYTEDIDDAFNKIVDVALNDEYSTLALFAAKAFEIQNNKEMAFKLYQVAAAEGDLYSIRALADMMMTGTGCTQDQNKALELYRQAAIRGDAVCNFVMGEFERNKVDATIANVWYARALVRGYNIAVERIQNVDVVKEKEQKDNVDKNNNDNNNLDKHKSVLDTSIKYCRKCGAKLSNDSLFCRKCGTKIIE